MHRGPTELSPTRIAEISEVIDRITGWAKDRRSIVGLLLVRSCVDGAMRPDSDIDIALLTTDEPRYSDNALAEELSLRKLIRTRVGDRSSSVATPRSRAWKSSSVSASPTWA
ncbi:nucleotidyltransferase domain-containing protein [Streptomyces sp. NBC_00210]|uniref:nucleotidyltransferase domain-containing protein n=1 Tax=Streptomyces sp. NBC_00210 TaxID=2903636 RepID=UPI00324802B5